MALFLIEECVLKANCPDDRLWEHMFEPLFEEFGPIIRIEGEPSHVTSVIVFEFHHKDGHKTMLAIDASMVQEVLN